jgi:uncharacterized protein (DUF1330 family)
MKKGYWVVTYRSVSDAAQLGNYSKMAGEALAKLGGKAIIRTSDRIASHEAGLNERTVVVEFESFDQAIAAYESEEYAVALEALGTAAHRDFRIVEGV